MTATGGPSERPEATGRGRDATARWVLIVATFALLVAYSFVQSPLPGVNEPHYLTKAKHYWQPSWCEGDLFLESANAHLVFYQTFGALAAVLPLPTAAVVGRLLASALLAWGWTRLTSRLLHRPSAGLLAVALFLMLATLGNWSGEWLVGGVESKVPAYALAFLGWSFLADRRLVAVGVSFGLAVSFHPLVGGWFVVATAAAIVWGCLRDRSRKPDLRGEDDASPSASAWAFAAAAFAAASVFGLVPAVGLLVGTDPELAAEATRIQVVDRLPHHLDPTHFRRADHRLFGLLVTLWIAVGPFRRGAAAEGSDSHREAVDRLWVRTVVASLAIAAVGLLAAVGTAPVEELPLAGLRLAVLKFYLFRLADVLVPVAVAIAVTNRLDSISRSRRIAVALAAAIACLAIPGVNRDAGRLSPAAEERWLDVCEFIRTQTPADAVCQTYGRPVAFKWHAQRPEYVSFKDMPQDAASLVEWQRRRRLVDAWPRTWQRPSGYGRKALDALHRETGIDLLIVPSTARFAVPAIKRNTMYKVIPVTPSEPDAE